MAELGELELEFTGSPPELCRTRFRHPVLLSGTPGNQVRAQRGRENREDRPSNIGQFQWTPAVKAFAIWALRCASWAKRSRLRDSMEPPRLEGGHHTRASSLSYAISMGNDWLGAIFGTDVSGDSHVRSVINRQNVDFKVLPSDPVVLSFNTLVLPAENIQIVSDGRKVVAPVEIDLLADEIQERWRGRPRVLPGQRRVPHVSVPPTSDAPGQVIVSLKLDRDFESYSLGELKEFVRALQLALKCSGVVPVGKREGCVEIGLRANSDDAKRLLSLAQSGSLEEFGVIGGRQLLAEEVTAFLDSLVTVTDSGTETTGSRGGWTAWERAKASGGTSEGSKQGEPDSAGTTLTHERARVLQERLRETEDQFRAARAIQRRLLPHSPPTLPGFNLAGASYSADVTGGDYYDYVPMLDGSTGIVVGDVSGHGFGSALIMASTRAYLRALAQTHTDVGTILTLANQFLCQDLPEGEFVSVFLAQLDPFNRTLIYGSAGQSTGYLLDRDGQVRRLLPSIDLPLGVLPESQFATSSPLELHAGDTLFLLTDGVVEEPDAEGILFGTERALAVVRRHLHLPAQEIVAKLHEAVCAHRSRGDTAPAVSRHPQLPDPSGSHHHDFTAVVLKTTCL